MSLVKKPRNAGHPRPNHPGGGAPKGYVQHERARDKIRTGVLVERLQGIASGKYPAEPHQVTAALGLLKKTLPDLSATDITSGGQSIIIERTQFGAK